MLKRVLPQRRDRAILLPVIGAQLIIGMTLFLAPLLIDALTEHAALSWKVAGLLLSMELAASALTTICLSTRRRNHSARRRALSGALLAVASTALTLISPALPLLFVTRLLAGVGAGVVGAEATSILSRGIDRERLIAILTVVSIINAAFWLAVLPYMIPGLGYRAPYGCLLLICICGTYLLSRLPSLSRRPASRQAVRSNFSVPALLAIAAVFMTQLGQGAFWSMAESYGRNAGFDGHAIGIILSFSTLILLLGAIGAAWAGDRFGRFASLLTLLALNALSILLVSTIAIHWVYVAANIVQAITNLSSVIYQLGLTASLDRRGRAIAMSTALVTLGNGIGPGFAGSLSASFGPSSVGVFVMALNALAFGLYSMIALRRAGEPQLSASLS